MRATCLSNEIATLPSDLQPRSFTGRGHYALTVGQSYQVVGMSMIENLLSFLVANDAGIPDFVPAGFFDDLQCPIPDRWAFAVRSGILASGPALWTDPVQADWGYQDLVFDPNHGAALVESDQEALTVFRRQIRDAELADHVRQPHDTGRPDRIMQAFTENLSVPDGDVSYSLWIIWSVLLRVAEYVPSFDLDDARNLVESNTDDALTYATWAIVSTRTTVPESLIADLQRLGRPGARIDEWPGNLADYGDGWEQPPLLTGRDQPAEAVSDHDPHRDTVRSTQHAVTGGHTYEALALMLRDHVLLALLLDDAHEQSWVPAELFNPGAWNLPAHWIVTSNAAEHQVWFGPDVSGDPGRLTTAQQNALDATPEV